MIGVIVLAAGKGERFGGDKMLAQVDDKTILEYTLDKVVCLGNYPIICVTSTKIQGCLNTYPEIVWAINDTPERGISYSIKCGIQMLEYRATTELIEGFLFLVGDQPGLHSQTIEGLIAQFRANPQKIHSVSYKGTKGNPVIFPFAFKQQLMALQGDKGGRVIIDNNQNQVSYYEVASEQELMDVDTKEVYRQFQRRNQTCNSLKNASGKTVE